MCLYWYTFTVIVLKCTSMTTNIAQYFNDVTNDMVLGGLKCNHLFVLKLCFWLVTVLRYFHITQQSRTLLSTWFRSSRLTSLHPCNSTQINNCVFTTQFYINNVLRSIFKQIEVLKHLSIESTSHHTYFGWSLHTALIELLCLLIYSLPSFVEFVDGSRQDILPVKIHSLHVLVGISDGPQRVTLPAKLHSPYSLVILVKTVFTALTELFC